MARPIGLGEGGTGSRLVFPSSASIFITNPATQLTELVTIGSGLSLSGGTLTASGGGGGGGGGTWGSITGTITSQTDLMSTFLSKTNTTSYTPSANFHPATKKYVDDTAVYNIDGGSPTSTYGGTSGVDGGSP